MSKDKIRESLERIVKELLPMPAALQAIVLSVNSDEATCKVKLVNSELELPAVRLRAITDSSTDGMVIKPEDDSKIIIGFVNGSIEEPYMISASIIESMYFRSEEFGGLIKIEDLVNRLNALEKDNNNLKTAFESWTSVAQDGGIALRMAVVGTMGGPALPAAWAGSKLEETTVANLENTKVKHG